MCGGGSPLQGQMTLAVGARGTEHGSRLCMGQGCPWVKSVYAARLHRSHGRAGVKAMPMGQGCAVISPSSVQLTDLYTWP